MSCHRPTVLAADDLRLVNCAGCWVELLGERQAEEFNNGKVATDAILPQPVCRRIRGRPYCRTCAIGPAKWETAGGSSGPIYDDDPSPWGENAVRALEECGEMDPP